MESIFQSPFGLLFVGLGLYMLPRMLRVGRAGMLVAQQDGGLPFFVMFMLVGVLIAFLVNSG